LRHAGKAIDTAAKFDLMAVDTGMYREDTALLRGLKIHGLDVIKSVVDLTKWTFRDFFPVLHKLDILSKELLDTNRQKKGD